MRNVEMWSYFYSFIKHNGIRIRSFFQGSCVTPQCQPKSNFQKTLPFLFGINASRRLKNSTCIQATASDRLDAFLSLFVVLFRLCVLLQPCLLPCSKRPEKKSRKIKCACQTYMIRTSRQLRQQQLGSFACPSSQLQTSTIWHRCRAWYRQSSFVQASSGYQIP